MTTDELLAIPHDGSMPVTHTSAFIRGLWPKRLRQTSANQDAEIRFRKRPFCLSLRVNVSLCPRRQASCPAQQLLNRSRPPPDRHTDLEPGSAAAAMLAGGSSAQTQTRTRTRTIFLPGPPGVEEKQRGTDVVQLWTRLLWTRLLGQTQQQICSFLIG